MLPGPASEVGNAIVGHPDVPYITFTGSPDVGWGIRQRAYQKKVGLELGNNAPVVVHDDAGWVESLVRRLTERHEATIEHPWSN